MNLIIQQAEKLPVDFPHEVSYWASYIADKYHGGNFNFTEHQLKFIAEMCQSVVEIGTDHAIFYFVG